MNPCHLDTDWCEPRLSGKLWKGSRPDGCLRLWARPLVQSRRLMKRLQTVAGVDINSITLEERIQGITVCYGRNLVMNNQKWPDTLYGIERGSNALIDARHRLEGNGRRAQRLHHNKIHICAGSVISTAVPGKIIYRP